MNILLLQIILIYNKIIINFAFTSIHMTEEHTKNSDLSYISNVPSQRFRRDSPPNTHELITIPGYRMNNFDSSNSANYPTQSLSSIFCPSNPSSYPLKSIVVSNIGSASGVTLSVPNQPSSIMNTAITRGPLLIFNNPPISQCYSLNFPPQTSGVKPIDMNNIKVQFIYDSTKVGGGGSTSIGSNNGFGGSLLPFTPNTNTVCGSVTCKNGGVCRYMGANGYQCQCDSSSQWLGADCSKPNPCILTPCKNSGQCYFLPDATYYCVCYSGYSGNNCQFSAVTTTTMAPATYNPCLSARPCLNGGTCLPKGNQGEFTCMCPQGYTGVNCQSLNYFSTTTTTPQNTCGISNSKSPVDYDRIVNGQPVYTNVWPWLVSLQTMPGGSHFCGGTLVDALHVITAAHCFDGSGTSPSMFKVVAGLLNLQQTFASGVQQLTIDRIFRHEQYSSTALVNDIAVIKLRTAAQINSAVYPICLPNRNGAQDPKVGQSVQIAGWGYTNSATKQLAKQLQQATIQVLDINGDLYGGPGCNAWIRRGYSMNNAQQICAMSRDTRTDSCQGDSGGPLIRNIGIQWFLFGIVSYGDAVCASSTAAGVYTRVSAYMPWIEQKLRL